MRKKLFLPFTLLLAVLFIMTHVDTAFSARNWVKTYGGSEDDIANSIQQTTDGGYIVAGSTESSGARGSDAWILKLNLNGSIDWQKTYGGSESDYVYSIQQTTDGGYVMAGYTESSGAEERDAWVLKLDSNGSIDWQKTYGGMIASVMPNPSNRPQMVVILWQVLLIQRVPGGLMPGY